MPGGFPCLLVDTPPERTCKRSLFLDLATGNIDPAVSAAIAADRNPYVILDRMAVAARESRGAQPGRHSDDQSVVEPRKSTHGWRLSAGKSAQMGAGD